MAITILGIRHHGVGSAKNVVEMLEKIKPDMILVEGPPELDAITKWVGEKDLKPPVSVLCYDENNPQRASFYPFAEFSPEWQALVFAKKHSVPVRMMDLPMSLSWALQDAKQQNAAAENEGKTSNSRLKSTKNAVYTEGENVGFSMSDFGSHSAKIQNPQSDIENTEGSVSDIISDYRQLFSLPNVLVSPHIAGWTHDSKERLARVLLYKISFCK